MFREDRSRAPDGHSGTAGYAECGASQGRARAADGFPVQIQDAVDFDGEGSCPLHVRQQGEGGPGVAAVLECGVQAAFAVVANHRIVLLGFCHSGDVDRCRPRAVRHIVIRRESCGEGDFRTRASRGKQHIGGADGHGVAAVHRARRLGHLLVIHKHRHLARCGRGEAGREHGGVGGSRPGRRGRGLDGDGVAGGEVAALRAVFVGFYLAVSQVGAGLQERDRFLDGFCVIAVVCISSGIVQIVCLCNRQCPASDRKGLAANRNAFVQLAGQLGCNIRRPVLPVIIEVGGDRDHIRRQIFGGERIAAA